MSFVSSVANHHPQKFYSFLSVVRPLRNLAGPYFFEVTGRRRRRLALPLPVEPPGFLPAEAPEGFFAPVAPEDLPEPDEDLRLPGVPDFDRCPFCQPGFDPPRRKDLPWATVGAGAMSLVRSG